MKRLTVMPNTIILFVAIVLALWMPKAGSAQDLPGVPQQNAFDQSIGGYQDQLPEVIIRGGKKSGVRSNKPTLDLQFDPDEPIHSAIEPEEELLQRQPESLRNPRAGFAESLANSVVILPARIRLAKNPVRVFYPLRQIMAISPSLSQEIGTGWEMAITNTDGRSFRKFSGGGLPPATIQWNGRSNRGEIVRAGNTYSTVITYKDIRGQSRNLVGEPFHFNGVIHQESRGLIITLSVASVFDRGFNPGDNETIRLLGLELLKESTDWIKRYYYTYPIRIECHSSNRNLAIARAQAVGKVLASLLLFPQGDIPANGNATDISRERIDIIITNR